MFFKNFKNKKVIVTGHTGFKGSWLSLWLYLSGAKVIGISDKTEKRSNYQALGLNKKILSKKIDIRNFNKLKKIFKKNNPDFVFHLAAQSLVKKSYDAPMLTFNTNSIGTLNLLESLRFMKKKCVIVVITSDKSYKNLELNRGYNEEDLLGGVDPYSASKACAELVIKSYFNSFLKKNKNLKIAVARAGNVIGGGDWSQNRLVPDCIKSWVKNKSVVIRNPRSTRPWQHVLEVLSGYLILAIKLQKNSKINGEAFNFGPKNFQNKSVINLIQEIKKGLPNFKWKIKHTKNFYESKLLKLNSQKAKKKLKWSNKLSFKQTIRMTTVWYKNFYSKKINMLNLSSSQIFDYEKKL